MKLWQCECLKMLWNEPVSAAFSELDIVITIASGSTGIKLLSSCCCWYDFSGTRRTSRRHNKAVQEVASKGNFCCSFCPYTTNDRVSEHQA